METLHPLLGTDKRNPFIEVLTSQETPNEIFVYYGLRLLEVIRRGKESIEEKLLIGRLYNAGFRRSALTSAFHLSGKTIAKIGGALKSGDGDRLMRTISGRRKKIPPEIEYYVRRKIQEVYPEKQCHTNKFIRDDLMDKFHLKTNKESIRMILNDELRKMEIAKRTAFSGNGKSPIEEEQFEISDKPVSQPIVPVNAEEQSAVRKIVCVRAESELSSNSAGSSSGKRENDKMPGGQFEIESPKPCRAGEDQKENGGSPDFSEKNIAPEIHSPASSENSRKPQSPRQNDTAPKSPLNCQNVISPGSKMEKNDNSSPSEGDDSSSVSHEKMNMESPSEFPLNCHENGGAGTGTKDDESGSLNPCGDRGPAAPVFLPPPPGPENCHHLGVLLFRRQMDELTLNLGGCRDMVRQWLTCVLCGAVNIEQSDDINFDTLEYLVGPQIVSLRHQRNALTRFATEENITELFRRNAAFIGADRHSFFLYDPHGVGYTGKRNILKCWLGSKGKVGKGYYLDFVHTVDGEPVMIFHDDNYYDLRGRFLRNIDKLRKILSGDQNRKLYIIVDRAIYDLEDLRYFREKNVYVITWEKGYVKGQWEKVAAGAEEPLFIKKNKNSSAKELIYKIEHVKRPWRRDATFAEHIVLITKPKEIADQPVEVSVICADLDLAAELALNPILNRWLQEEDFLYETRNMGLNEITSYKYDSYLKIIDRVNDKLMENRKYTKLCAGRLQSRKKLGLEVLEKQEFDERTGSELKTLGRKIAGVESEIEKVGKRSDAKKIENLKKIKRALKKKLNYLNGKQKKFVRSYEKATGKLKEQIKSFDEQIDIEPQRISRIEHLLKNEFVKLNFMPKAFMDAVKITARNIFHESHKIYRPLRDDFRRDHVVVRSVTRAHGYIRESRKNMEVMLEPTRRLCRATKKAVLEFMRTTSRTINEKYDLKKKLRFSLYNNRSFGNDGKTRKTDRKW